MQKVELEGLEKDISTIRHILSKHSISVGDLTKVLEKGELLIPLSIFKAPVGPLSALVVFLKDNKGLRLSEIAKLLSRDQRTIWATYSKAKPRIKGFDINYATNIGIAVFSSRSLSIMENLVYHLRSVHNMRLVEIARLIGRSNKTVWCFYNRAIKKNE